MRNSTLFCVVSSLRNCMRPVASELPSLKRSLSSYPRLRDSFSPTKPRQGIRTKQVTNSRTSQAIALSIPPRVSLLLEIQSRPGALHEVLKYFWKYDIDLTHIESRPLQNGNDGFLIYLDFEGNPEDPKASHLISDLKHHRPVRSVLLLGEKEVPWFPRHLKDLDLIANRTLDAGDDLESDHPGFHDQEYRKRRTMLAELARQYQCGSPLPRIDYLPYEIDTWAQVYKRLQESQRKYACQEYLNILRLMEKECGYGTTSIPQFTDISSFLQRRTGFQLRPVAGLLSSRDFLNALAFRVFFSTQYIRHSSKPLYTPEPDICHELLGHAPMFADPDFADFSQEIGLASLGASNHDIKRLATCYWHSVEFGLVKEQKNHVTSVKAYGAGLLSSFGELEYSCATKTDDFTPSSEAAQPPRYEPWNPEIAAETSYPITNYQPKYFIAESLNDAKVKMRHFCENLPKPFHARLNTLNNSIWVDRAVRISKDC